MMLRKVFFEQDISFGQVIATFVLLGTKMNIPQFLVDFTMTWEGQGVWHRISRLLGLSVKIGDYDLKSIIDGQGKQGTWFNKGWLTYRGGDPVLVPYIV